MALCLLATGAVGAVRIAASWHVIAGRTARQSLVEEAQLAPGAAPLALDGVTTGGQRIALVVPKPGVRRYAAFVVHGAALRHDLAFWTQVAAHLPAKSAVALVGYCDDEACIRGTSRMPLPPSITLIGYAEFHTGRVLLRADEQRTALVLTPEFTVIGTAPWNPHASPGDVAAAILGVK